MQIFLELSGHPKANIKRVALAGNTVIGRSKKCGLQIASASVSRKHCEVRIGENEATVVDLGSSNGTFVASERIPAGEEVPLAEGTRLNIGGIRFLVSYTKQGVAKPIAPDSSGETTADAAVVAATAPAAGDLLDDEAPLPLDEGDSLLGFADETEAPMDKSEPASSASAAEGAIPDDEPLAINDDDDLLPVGPTVEADIQSAGEDPILGEDSLILANDESVLLVDDNIVEEEKSDDEAVPMAEEPAAAVAEAAKTPAPVAEESKADESEEEDYFEESEEATDESKILGDLEEDEPILVFDDDEGPLATDMASESNVNLDDSATYFGDTDREETEDRSEANAEAESGLDGDEDEDVALIDEEADEEDGEDEEAALISDEDEDQAFSFLDDDDEDKPTQSKANTNDSELGDFLSHLGRE